MKKFWFERKTYGWGWRPKTWQGWLATFVYSLLFVEIFLQFNSDSRLVLARDVSNGIFVPLIVLTCVFIFVTWFTGERPAWPALRRGLRQGEQWGKRVEYLEDVLLGGGVAVIPTDTTYGIVGSALNEKTVNEIYRLRKRDLNKPFIILIADKKNLKKFGVVPTEAQEKILDRVWSYNASRSDKPKPTSVILPCTDERFAYLHRGGNTLAFRLPAKAALRRLLRATGPLVAPSANPQGHPVARTIDEARAYFGNQVDFYQDGAPQCGAPSRLVDITDGTEKVLR